MRRSRRRLEQDVLGSGDVSPASTVELQRLLYGAIPVAANRRTLLPLRSEFHRRPSNERRGNEGGCSEQTITSLPPTAVHALARHA